MNTHNFEQGFFSIDQTQMACGIEGQTFDGEFPQLWLVPEEHTTVPQPNGDTSWPWPTANPYDYGLESESNSYASGSYLHSWDTQPLSDAELAHLRGVTDDYTSSLDVGDTSLFLTSPVDINPHLHSSLYYEDLLTAPSAPEINNQESLFNLHDSIEALAHTTEQPLIQQAVEGQHSPFQFNFRYPAPGASYPPYSLPPPMSHASTNPNVVVTPSLENASSNKSEKIPTATSSTPRMSTIHTGAIFGTNLTNIIVSSNTRGECVLRWTEPITPSECGRATKRRKTTHSRVFSEILEPQVEIKVAKVELSSSGEAEVADSPTSTEEATEASESDSPVASNHDDEGGEDVAEGSTSSSVGTNCNTPTTPSTSSPHRSRTWIPRLRCEWKNCSPPCFTVSVDEMMKEHLKVHGITLSKNKPKAKDGAEVAPVECMWEGCGKLITRSSLRNHMRRKHVKADRFRHAECSLCGDVVDLKDVVEH